MSEEAILKHLNLSLKLISSR